MPEKFASKRNVKFMLYEVFQAEKLCDYEFFHDHSRETFEMITDTIFKISNDDMYPLYQELDSIPPQYCDGQAKVHPAISDFIKKCGSLGLININWSYEDGGQQVPSLVSFIGKYYMAAANWPLSVFIGLTAGAANLILNFASQKLKDLYLEKMINGQWQGTMALTEPDAGSSLSDIRTTAEDSGQGYYLIKGKKLFISAGDTNAVENTVHLMLARIKGSPAGVKGISLFIVPKYRVMDNGTLEYNDVYCDGIEHKLGYKACPACQLTMGDNNGCRGYLVGEANMGLSYMFQMMNSSRIGTGIGAIGKATAAYYAALNYSKQRLQGRKPDQKDPSSPQVPIIEHADIKRMLLFQRSVCEGALSLALQLSKYQDLKKVGVEPEKYELLIDFLVPIVKSFPAEYGVLSVSAAMQCMGGYGFCRDFPVEQYYRDIRIDPIHEGTTGIQGQDLLGRKTTMRGGKAYQTFMEEVKRTITDALIIPELKPRAEELFMSLGEMDEVTFYLKELNSQKGSEQFLSDATIYLEMVGLIAIAWQWLIQGIAAIKSLKGDVIDSDANFYKAKLMTLNYFFTYELPKVKALSSIMKNSNGLTLNMETKLFDEP